MGDKVCDCNEISSQWSKTTQCCTSEFCTYHAIGSVVPELLHTVFEAIVIEKTGLVLPNYSRVFFEGQAIVYHIGAIGKTKNRHVFSTMEDMNFGEDSQI